MAEKLLEIKNLHVLYKTDEDDVYALNGVDLDLEKGETLGLVGETGAGKSTIALSIMKLLPDRTGFITEGEIRFDGKDLVHIKEEEMRSMRGNDISMIFADPMSALNPLHTVGNQIAEVIELHNSNLSHDEIEKKVDEILKFYLGPIYNLRRKLGDKDFSELMYFIEMANKKIGEEGELE